MSQPEFHTSSNPKEEASEYLTSFLKQHLSNGEKVLWLVPGGSAIAVAVKVAENLEGESFKNLVITLTDERYGEVGHADSSWSQLMQNGFKVDGATIYPVLQGKSIEETVRDYSESLKKFIAEADYVVGLFGIGADGHTAGILPESIAVQSTDMAFGYKGGNYYRITVTPRTISFIDEIIVYAVGAEKKKALEDLKQELPLIKQPAQALKQVDRLIIFKD